MVTVDDLAKKSLDAACSDPNKEVKIKVFMNNSVKILDLKAQSVDLDKDGNIVLSNKKE